MGMIQKRVFEAFFQVRGTPSKIIGSIPYDSPSVPIDGFFTEYIRPGAFAAALKSGQDIKSYWSHNREKVIGSTKSGTLKLTDTANELRIELDPGSTSWGKDALEAVRRGDVTGFSFGFIPQEEDYSADGKSRYIVKANLLEVSPVAEPAYPATKAFARSSKKQESIDTKEMQSFFSDGRKEKMTKEKVKRMTDYWTDKGFKDNEDFLKAIIRHYSDPSVDLNTMDPRLDRAASGLSGDGYPAPDKLMFDLIKGPSASELYRRCTIYPLGDFNSLRLPAIDEKTRSNSQYGGATSYRESEADEATATDPKFRMVHLKTKKIITLAYLTDEIIQEAVDNYCSNTLTVANSRKINYSILNGTGVGQFLGIVNADCTITAAAEGGQVAGTFVAENAAQMVSHLPEECHHNLTAWLVNPVLYATMVLQQYTAGNTSAPLIRWRSGGEKFNKMLGFDLIPVGACATPGQPGDIILADLTQYIIAEKQVNKTISGHLRFLNDESALRLVYRADGQPAWAAPVTPENSTVKVSPFVMLEAR